MGILWGSLIITGAQSAYLDISVKPNLVVMAETAIGLEEIGVMYLAIQSYYIAKIYFTLASFLSIFFIYFLGLKWGKDARG